ncbi:protein patched homolog 1-like isoform X1 [Branchiostoma floridae x Branchiostoma japonicum]
MQSRAGPAGIPTHGPGRPHGHVPRTDSGFAEERHEPSDHVHGDHRSSSPDSHTEPDRTRPEQDAPCARKTSCYEAREALRHIDQGRATGNKQALYLREKCERCLFNTGKIIQLHCGKVLFVGVLVMVLLAVFLKDAKIETETEKLWVQAGGRLEEELRYTKESLGEEMGTDYQVIITTAKNEGDNVLTHNALNQHLQSVLAAADVQVELFGVDWNMKDVCYVTSLPVLEGVFAMTIEKLYPCVIITPLDCFWEGSKLLGPDRPVIIPNYSSNVRWTNLNPLGMLEELNKSSDIMASYFPLDTFQDLFDKAGITTGYQEKPCLNPEDPECPETAPNKYTKEVPDFNSELTGGCAGFATKYMQWPEELIVGGLKKNQSGQITSAEALQTAIVLSQPNALYEYYKDDYKVHDIHWSPSKAGEVLEEWQRKFTEAVYNSANDSLGQQVHAFSSAALNDLLQDFSQTNYIRVAAGYCLMLVYACVTMLRRSAVRSQGGVGLAGVILVSMSVAAALGFCTLIGLSFNASTTQVLPFVALGLGVDDMFLVAHTFSCTTSSPNVAYLDQTGECLRRTGVSVTLTSLSIIVSCFMGAIVPIPALRNYSIQSAVVVFFNYLSVILIFPAIISWDLERRRNKRLDIFCCLNSSSSNRVIRVREATPEEDTDSVRSEPLPRHSQRHQTNVTVQSTVETVTSLDNEGRTVTVVVPPTQTVTRPWIPSNVVTPIGTPPSTAESSSTRNLVSPDFETEGTESSNVLCCAKKNWTLSSFARNTYGPFLARFPVKIAVLVAFALLLVGGIYGTTTVEDGLDTTDVVPKGSREHDFLRLQSKYFSFYNMYIVTQSDYDYPNGQAGLDSLHEDFMRVNKIVLTPEGNLPEYWLSYFRQWLFDVQAHFDEDWQLGRIQRNKWFYNATNEGVMGYKLLVQTGDNDNPINKDQLYSNRLIDSNGVINSKAFYIYLTAWVNDDTFAYTASQAAIRPEPEQWGVDRNDHDNLDTIPEYELRIPKSQPINYSQFSFYVSGLKGTSEYIQLIKEVREVCEESEVPTYPLGVPFTYWEQYIFLRYYLMVALAAVLAAIFVVVAIVMVNPWLALIVVSVLAMMAVELFGVMGLLGIKLSAIPAVIIIASVGIGVEFTVHICFAYVTSLGDRNERMVSALEHMMSPVIDGAISTLLGVVMLAGSEFEFIVLYFFYVLVALVIIGLLNGLILLPVLLSLIGPGPEVKPANNATHLPTPTPPPTPPFETGVPMDTYPRVQRSDSLGSDLFNNEIAFSGLGDQYLQQRHSDIVVSPEVKVETGYLRCGPKRTKYNAPVRPTERQTNRPKRPPKSKSRAYQQPSHHVTTVTATTSVTVQIGQPTDDASADSYRYSKRRRDDIPKLYELEYNSSDSSRSSEK